MQGLGSHFHDDRCYYNNLDHKADWPGSCVDGVPVLRTVKSNTEFVFPITVFLFGLGSLDRYFLTNRENYLDQVRRVSAWMVKNILPNGSFDNKCNIVDPKVAYYSNNSAMCQGLALSFLTRVIRYGLVDSETCRHLDNLLEPMKTSMLTPVDQGGTMLCTDKGPALLEFCLKQHTIILNGWIYAVFGLMDYVRHKNDEKAKEVLDCTILAMVALLPQYRLPSGWSYYDDQGRISSPFYHALHVALLDAMHRLTGQTVFREYMESFERTNHIFNRFRYTLVKIKDKLHDTNECAG
jgi:hypothetical protein